MWPEGFAERRVVTRNARGRAAKKEERTHAAAKEAACDRSSRLALVLVPFLVMLGHANVASAQTPKPDPTHRDVLLRHWTEIGDKIVKMAEEFPEDKYEFRPVPGVRTFADNLRHVAFWNTYVSKTVKGEKVDPKINELPKAEYATKAAIVKALKSSLDEATDLLKKSTAGAVRQGLGPLGRVHRALGRALRAAGRLFPAERHRAAGVARRQLQRALVGR